MFRNIRRLAALEKPVIGSFGIITITNSDVFRFLIEKSMPPDLDNPAVVPGGMIGNRQFFGHGLTPYGPRKPSMKIVGEPATGVAAPVVNDRRISLCTP